MTAYIVLVTLIESSVIVQDGEPVTALALSPEAKTLFVASRSLQLRCFDVDTGQYLRSFKVNNPLPLKPSEVFYKCHASFSQARVVIYILAGT